MLFGFLAVNFTGLKEFSFQGTIDGVEPVKALRLGASSCRNGTAVPAKHSLPANSKPFTREA